MDRVRDIRLGDKTWSRGTGILQISPACLWLLWILPKGGIPVLWHEEAAQKVIGKQNLHGGAPTLFITSLVAKTKYSTEAT